MKKIWKKFSTCHNFRLNFWIVKNFIRWPHNKSKSLGMNPRLFALPRHLTGEFCALECMRMHTQIQTELGKAQNYGHTVEPAAKVAGLEAPVESTHQSPAPVPTIVIPAAQAEAASLQA